MLGLFTLWANGQDSWNINLMSVWRDSISSTPTIPDNSDYNEVYGFAYEQREYAIIGTSYDTKIIDVTDPLLPEHLFSLPGSPGAIHRDYHTYGNYLYAVSEEDLGGGGIYDLQYLPDSVVSVTDSTYGYYGAHNIFIDTGAALLYGCSSYLTIYSLANPENPQFLAYHYLGDFTHDVWVENDTMYANVSSALKIYNMADVALPELIGELPFYPQQGYNHSGWKEGNTYVLCDETHGLDIKILDVSDLNNISVLALVGSDIDSNSVPHNAMIKDGYLYVSYYFDGLYIWNIKNPSSPFLAGYYDTFEYASWPSYDGAWGVYSFLPSGTVLVSDMTNGLFVFDVSPALAATGIGNHPNADLVNSLQVYPNPSASKITLEIEGCSNVQILTLKGEIIKTIGRPEPGEVDVSELSSGVYLVKVTDGNGQFHVRQIVKK